MGGVREVCISLENAKPIRYYVPPSKKIYEWKVPKNNVIPKIKDMIIKDSLFNSLFSGNLKKSFIEAYELEIFDLDVVLMAIAMLRTLAHDDIATKKDVKLFQREFTSYLKFKRLN